MKPPHTGVRRLPNPPILSKCFEVTDAGIVATGMMMWATSQRLIPIRDSAR